MSGRSAGGESHAPVIDLQRFAESKRDRLIRLGRERRAEARRLEARAKIVSREAGALTRNGRPRAAAAARAEAAELRARAARQKELAAQYKRELAELRVERARERARRRAQLLREKEARRRRKRGGVKKQPVPRRRKPVKRGGRKRHIRFEVWPHLTPSGYIEIRLSEAAGSREARWHNAVQTYLNTGDASALRSFEGKSVRDETAGRKPAKNPPGTGKRFPFVTDTATILKYAAGFDLGDRIYRDERIALERPA